jgi:hypothetical protein
MTAVLAKEQPKGPQIKLNAYSIANFFEVRKNFENGAAQIRNTTSSNQSFVVTDDNRNRTSRKMKNHHSMWRSFSNRLGTNR